MRLVRILLVCLSLPSSACSLLNEPRFACNPVLAAGDSQCDAGEKCVVSEDPQVAECQADRGTSFVGDACRPTGGGDDCIGGMACLPSIYGKGVDNLCRRICRLGTDGDCREVVDPNGPLVCAPPDVKLARYGFCCPKGGC